VTEAATLAGGLVSAGLGETERAAKSRLFQRVLDQWRRDGRSPWTAAWWVPGRLEVFGTHTDYAGGRSLVAPVPRGFVFLAASRADRLIHVVDARDAGADDAVTVAQDDEPTRFRGWRHYVEVTAGRLARNFPDSALGADIVFASDLPRAAGMSSSSALVVGVATALVHAGALRDRAEWQRSIRSAIDEAGYLACVENGRSFGELMGDAGVGTHGGSEDHAAMLAGTAGAFSAFAFVPMRHLDTVAVPAAWTVVVATSGVGSHKTGTERAAYNRLSEGTAALLDLWNTRRPDLGRPDLQVGRDPRRPDLQVGRDPRDAGHDSLAAALASSASALPTLRARVADSVVPGWTVAALLDRLDHFVREDGRIGEAVLAVRNADATVLGRLAAQSQADAERLLVNQVPETSALVRLAVEAGAIAARSFGAGFGGSVWAIVETADAARFAERWMSAYRVACPEAAERSIVFESNPGPAVTRVG
jgi:galactokinase